MAAKSLELVGPKIIDAINQMIKSQNNITQSATGAAIHANDAQELSIPVQFGFTERTHTGSELIPASDQVLFAVGFLPILDNIIIKLTDLTELANEYSRRNSEANTDVDTFKTTTRRLQFLSLAEEHVMIWKATVGTDMRGISFSSNSDNMIKFREQFFKQSLDDMDAEKMKNGQATMGQVITKKTFQTTLGELTKLTNRLKYSKYCQDANPAEPLQRDRLGIVTKTIRTVEKIVEDMEEIVKDTGQVSFTPTEAYTPDKRMKTAVVNLLLSFFYCADNVDEFKNAVQTSALLVTTTAITGKGAAGDKQMQGYFYNFIEALFDTTKAQALKKELDKKADKFKRTPSPCYTINVPSAKIADQLEWPTEVRLKAADLFTQKAVRVPKHAPKDATQMEDLKPVIEVNPTQEPPNHVRGLLPCPPSEGTPRSRADPSPLRTPRPGSGRGTESPTSPVPGGLLPLIPQSRLIPKGPLRPLPIKFDPDV
jgi:hypothetical protein